MFSIVALIFIGVILIAVSILVGAMMQLGDDGDRVGGGNNTQPNRVSRADPAKPGTRTGTQNQGPPPPTQLPSLSNGQQQPKNRVDTTQRSATATPVHTHYRSPSQTRSDTPQLGATAQNNNNQDRSSQPQTHQPSGSGAAGETAGRHKPNDSEHDIAFKTFEELTQPEKHSYVDVKDCFFDITRDVLKPILEEIGHKDGGTTPIKHVVVYVGKDDDGNISPADRKLRKSFKIKHPNNSLYRFARMSVEYYDDHYRLRMKDYTPYIEEKHPKYDLVNHRVSTDKTRWQELKAELYNRTVKVPTTHIKILCPAK